MASVDMKVNIDTAEAEANLARLLELQKQLPKPRSGWHSTKLHLALIMMALVMVGWFSLTADRRAVTFDAMVFGLATAAGIFSTTRVAESFAQRPAKEAKPEVTEP
jgi:hypothetical protein